jgi:GPI mannosyltransferase 3
LRALASSLAPKRACVGSYGDLTWEWAPETQLRGYAHPLLFAALYKALALLGLDSSNAVMVYAPRILQGACAAACDCAVYRLARRWFDETTARWALACSLLSWFNCFCAVRPFSNCLEATLCTAALSLWPFNSASSDPHSKTTGSTKDFESSPPSHHRVAALLLGAASCSLRPPITLLWLVLGGHHLLQLLQGDTIGSSGGSSCRFASPPVVAAWRYLCEAVGCVSLVFVACGVIDRVLYGEWTFPPWNFLVWNAVTVRR